MQEGTFILAIGGALMGAIFGLLGVAAAVWGLAAAHEGIKKWNTLVERFPLRAEPDRWQALDWFVVHNSCSFRQCGRMAVNDDYLWIAPPAIFSWLLAPVQLPWAETTSKELTKNNEFKLTILNLNMRMPGEMIPVELRRRIGVQA